MKAKACLKVKDDGGESLCERVIWRIVEEEGKIEVNITYIVSLLGFNVRSARVFALATIFLLFYC